MFGVVNWNLSTEPLRGLAEIIWEDRNLSKRLHRFPLLCQGLIRQLSPSQPNYNLEAYKSPEGPDLKAIGYYSGELKVLTEKMTFSPPGTPSINLKPLFTPGHSVDHMCFAMLVGDTVECIFVGDLLLGGRLVVDIEKHFSSDTRALHL